MSELKNKGTKIADEKLKDVNGGFRETDGIAAGCTIECPRCHNTDKDKFEKWIDLTKGEMYRCKVCGEEFSYNQKGSMINPNEINLA
ncbi:MAG: hypothetical protein K6G27_06810 [Lachnospiraceae bacterium]|nr:hypothetical protein [Lachnospiraceae bacterium]